MASCETACTNKGEDACINSKMNNSLLEQQPQGILVGGYPPAAQLASQLAQDSWLHNTLHVFTRCTHNWAQLNDELAAWHFAGRATTW